MQTEDKKAGVPGAKGKKEPGTLHSWRNPKGQDQVLPTHSPVFFVSLQLAANYAESVNTGQPKTNREGVQQNSFLDGELRHIWDVNSLGWKTQSFGVLLCMLFTHAGIYTYAN